MTPEILRFGREQNPVIVFDNFTGDVGRACAIADAMAPFPAVTDTYYPGVRRLFGQGDNDALGYLMICCRRAAPFMAPLFGFNRLELVSASFSMVTTAPDRLRAQQRKPHFDSTDPNQFALLHYLRIPVPSGTAFYRQRSTGIEQVTPANVATFNRIAESETPQGGYIQGSDPHFEETGRIEAVADRMIVYRGSMLHSGLIPPNMPLSSDPTTGRLTANFFVRGL
ncbi:DUF6445 family protein [Sphingomonas sp. ASV193]|uniref:DUF6445 family protein n=1 Tax=Sphingomonas sp. ASV193 TaxID=3144405 RepID=UPI0032E900C4